MTLSAAHAPFDVYLGQRGVTLNAGKIYIGVAGMDPETNPQAVFWDEAATIPAFQPLDVMGGFVMRNGSPARFYTADTFSIRVRDRLNAQVYYEQNAQTGYSLGLGNFLQAGVSAQTRNAQEKMREAVSVLDFVDKADQATAQNGTTNIGYALTRALAAGFGDIEFPWCLAGYNLGATSYTVGTGQFVRGDGMVKVFSQSASYLFGLAGYITPSGVGGMSVDMTGAPPGSSAVRFLNGAAVVYGTRVWDMQFDNCYNAIGDEGSTHYIADNRFSNIKTRYQKGPCVRLRFTQGFQRWEYLNMDYTWAYTGAYLQTWVAFSYEKLAGLQMNECFHTGQELVMNLPGAPGASFIPTCGGFSFLGGGDPYDEFMWHRLVRSESSCGFGISYSHLQHVRVEQVEAFSGLGLGVVFDTCELVTCNNLSGRGSYTKVGSVAGGHGVTFKDCLTVLVTNLNTNANNGSGLKMENTSDALIVNHQSANNARYGIEESGTSDRNFYGPTTTASNGLGVALLTGAASVHVPRPTGSNNANTWAERQTFTKPTQSPTYTVAGLPSASPARQKAFVSDGSAAYTGGLIGTVVAGGGANLVPVYSNGTVWIVG